MGIKQGINKISFTLVLAQAMYEDLATDATLSVKCNIAIIIANYLDISVYCRPLYSKHQCYKTNDTWH